MTTPQSLQAHRWFAVVVGGCFFAPLTGTAQRVAVAGSPATVAGDTLVVFRGVLSAASRPVLRRIELDRVATGWEITLDIADPAVLDVDLFVYGAPPVGRSPADTLCRSEGVGQRETCRLLPTPRGPVWVTIVPVDGEGHSSYVLRARILRAPVIQGTNLVVNDARPLDDSGAVQAEFGATEFGVGEAGQHLYEVRHRAARPEGWVVSVVSADPTVALAVSAYDTSGVRIATAVGRAGYQDLLVGRPGARWYVMVGLAKAESFRRAASYSLSLTRAGEAIPVGLVKNEFQATGTEDRTYSLSLRRGQSATVAVEGRAALIATFGDSLVPVTSFFSNALQRAWVGAPVGSSRYLLQGVAADGQLQIRVAARRDTLRYQRRSDWSLRVVVSSLEQRYLVRLTPSNANPWLKWWSNPLTTGTIAPGEIAMIEVPVPPDVASTAGGNLPTQRAPVVTRPVSRPQFLARLSDSATGRFDLAVCTGDGQALDIGDALVRWEWPNGASTVYLVVLPDPWSDAAPGGEFGLELARSEIGKMAN